ncbi:hypothetical protein EYF80_025020 [Liparis tanakae]|uniref:Uncharacterized protein n=1 Tax=Liparis tanakae TaxID=230148 RepID=A0A4Z2HIG1_9TELE|nr:hypothetical protein EYF80_025020 [Liparis tanakae]
MTDCNTRHENGSGVKKPLLQELLSSLLEDRPAKLKGLKLVELALVQQDAEVLQQRGGLAWLSRNTLEATDVASSKQVVELACKELFTTGEVVANSQAQSQIRVLEHVVDDLAACQTGVAVKNFHRLRVAFHAPVVDGIVSHKCNCVKGDPLPEGDFLFAPLRDAYRQNDMPRLNEARCGCRGALPAARIDQL